MKDNRRQIDIQAVVTQLKSSVGLYSHGLQAARSNCRSVGHGSGCGDVISARSPGHHQSRRRCVVTPPQIDGGHCRCARFQPAKLAESRSFYFPS